MNTQSVLELVNVHKRYGATCAADGINLRVDRGETIALLGPNGAGKTTSIDIALGLITADSGTSSLFGMSARDAIRRGLVGVVQQADSLLPQTRVRQLLQLVAATHVEPLAIAQAMEFAGISHLGRKKVGKCSGGERQRIRLALALLSDPRLLILDEPTTGMDVEARESFWSFIAEQAGRGRSIVFATHYLAEAQKYAQRTVIMANGRILADAPTTQIRREYARCHLSISYTCPDEQAARALNTVAAKVSAHAGILRAEGENLDDAARIALDLPGAANLEVSTSSLEAAYLNLVEGVRR